MNTFDFEITEEHSGQRLDVFLSTCTEFTRSNIQKLIKSEQITVNGLPCKANHQLRLRDFVQLIVPPATATEIVAENIPLDIVFQDAHIAVINKPVDMVVHPAAGNYNHTLVNAILYHCKDLSGINGELRPGIVHRLDKDTTGVMVIAKNDAAHVHLATQIENKSAQRIYIALVFGNVKNDTGEIITNIARDSKDRKKMSVVKTGGKHAHTTYRVLERFGEYTLVCCKLHTGRTHQIRVHMAHLGHPLVGDEKYTTRSNKFGAKTQLLHSAVLTLRHPHNNVEMKFCAKLPALFLKILNILRKTRKR